VARLVWDASGERFYEIGVDRGVLYAPGQPGVPWIGLTSVSESSDGGEARPYYFDGQKYLNLSAAEEFQATIEAFSSPPEFAVCEGMAQIQNGLFVTQQPRKSFGLCYRTLIGNDTEGDAKGYKIHVVYNALAAPAAKTRSTMSSGSVEPSKFSWALTTLAPPLAGKRPTAHLVIDTRYTPEALLASVEDILYGSAALSASLPTPQELYALFTA